MKKTIALLLLATIMLSVFVAAEQWNTGKVVSEPKYKAAWSSWAATPEKCNFGIIVKNSQGKEVCTRHRGYRNTTIEN